MIEIIFFIIRWIPSDMNIMEGLRDLQYVSKKMNISSKWTLGVNLTSYFNGEHIFIGTGGGVIRAEMKGDEFVPEDTFLMTEGLVVFINGDDKNLVITSRGDGVYIYSLTQNEVLSHIPLQDCVRAILKENYLYVLSDKDVGIYSIDGDEIIKKEFQGITFTDMEIENDTIFLSHYDGLLILDMNTLDSIKAIILESSQILNICVDDSIIYGAGGTNGTYLISKRTGEVITRIYPDGYFSSDLFISGDTLYVAGRGSGVYLYYSGVPDSPVLLKFQPTWFNVLSITSSKDCIFLSSLEFFQILSRTTLEEEASLSFPSYFNSMDMSNDTLFVASSNLIGVTPMEEMKFRWYRDDYISTIKVMEHDFIYGTKLGEVYIYEGHDFNRIKFMGDFKGEVVDIEEILDSLLLIGLKYGGVRVISERDFKVKYSIEGTVIDIFPFFEKKFLCSKGDQGIVLYKIDEDSIISLDSSYFNNGYDFFFHHDILSWRDGYLCVTSFKGNMYNQFFDLLYFKVKDDKFEDLDYKGWNFGKIYSFKRYGDFLYSGVDNLLIRIDTLGNKDTLYSFPSRVVDILFYNGFIIVLTQFTGIFVLEGDMGIPRNIERVESVIFFFSEKQGIHVDDSYGIEVYDLSGRRVRFHRKGEYIHIDSSRGIYFLKIEHKIYKVVKP